MQEQKEVDPVEAGEFTVTDELYRISEATNDDGTVDVGVVDFEKSSYGGNVIVTFRSPTGDRYTETMEWPKKDDEKYKFVRLCRETVGGLNGANHIKTDGVTAKADPDEWELKIPKAFRKRISFDTYNWFQQTSNVVSGVYWISAIVMILYGVLTIIYQAVSPVLNWYTWVPIIVLLFIFGAIKAELVE